MTAVAFFDMDLTVLTAGTGPLFLRFLALQGNVGMTPLLRAYFYAALHKAGVLDYPSAMARIYRESSGACESKLEFLCRRFFDNIVKGYVSETAVERLATHRVQKHHVVLISASVEQLVAPVAHHLGFDAHLCTHLEVIDGRLSGRTVKPDCYGANKVFWARQYLDQHSADSDDAYFYSDSHVDLPLLESVGHPIAVNPNERLLRVARTRGWPVQSFR